MCLRQRRRAVPVPYPKPSLPSPCRTLNPPCERLAADAALMQHSTSRSTVGRVLVGAAWARCRGTKPSARRYAVGAAVVQQVETCNAAAAFVLSDCRVLRVVCGNAMPCWHAPNQTRWVSCRYDRRWCRGGRAGRVGRGGTRKPGCSLLGAALCDPHPFCSALLYTPRPSCYRPAGL